MKQKNPELSTRYLDALRAHLATSGQEQGLVARGLGREVIAAGLDALDLARMHERALTRLATTHDFPNASNGLHARTGLFFADALFPVERTHRSTRDSRALTSGNRQLRREVARRKAGENALKRSQDRCQALLIQSRVMPKKLRNLAHQILQAQETERRMISRELHDEVVQILVGINVQLAALNRSASVGVRALRASIARTQRLVEKSVNSVHQFARELRPAVLDDLGLIPALHAFMKPLAQRRKLRISLTAFAGIERLDPEHRTVLYRVALEALTNVGRHARARNVDVVLRTVPGGVQMQIRDDGVSFKVPADLAARSVRRLGLVGMRERMHMIGGTLAIESAPGAGTTVSANLPHPSSLLS